MSNLQFYNRMKTNNTKPLCKFRQHCRDYKVEKECKFSHEGFTKQNGYEAPPNQQSDQTVKVENKIETQFQKPKSQTPCRFDTKCTRRAKGKCGFKHSEAMENADDKKVDNIPNKAEILCRFGQKCKTFPQGKCLFKHQTKPTASTQSHKQNILKSHIFEHICTNFLQKKQCSGSCQKLHQFTDQKTISRVFSRKDQVNEVKKLMIVQQHEPKQSALYAILLQNRVCFGNLKSSTEGQHDNCHLEQVRQDIQFEGLEIQNAWHTRISQKNNSINLMVCKCNNSLKIVTMNLQTQIEYPINQQVLNVFSIDNYLMILLNSGKVTCLEYIFSSNQFQKRGDILKEQQFVFIKKYNSPYCDEEIIAGVTHDNTLCFINKKLLICTVKLDKDTNNQIQRVVDIAITQETPDPVALVLTSKGKVFSLNLLTFSVSILFQPESDCSYAFSCLAMTRSHLFIAIQSLGVLVYNVQKYDRPVGIIGIDSKKWNIQYDLQGNLVLTSEDQSGKKDISIFNVRNN